MAQASLREEFVHDTLWTWECVEQAGRKIGGFLLASLSTKVEGVASQTSNHTGVAMYLPSFKVQRLQAELANDGPNDPNDPSSSSGRSDPSGPSGLASPIREAGSSGSQ